MKYKGYEISRLVIVSVYSPEDSFTDDISDGVEALSTIQEAKDFINRLRGR